MRAAAVIRRLQSPVRRAFSWLRGLAPDLLFFGGLLVAAIGIGMIYTPAGVIAAGAALTGSVYLAVKK